MYPSKVTNLIIMEWGMVHMTFFLNYHHRLLMGFSKVIVINRSIGGIKAVPYSQLSQCLNKAESCKQPAEASRTLLFLKEDKTQSRDQRLPKDVPLTMSQSLVKVPAPASRPVFVLWPFLGRKD